MLILRGTVWSALWWLAAAQNSTQNATQNATQSAAQSMDLRDYNSLCDGTIDSANASGVFSFDPDVLSLTQRAANVSWAYTVYRNESSMQAMWWYNTGGANYSDDFGIGYDVCGFRFQNVTKLGMWKAHNEPDDGSCSSVLDKDCIDDLKKLAKEVTEEQVGVVSANQNLTEGALPKVCKTIGETLQANLPKKCKKYFDPNFSVSNFQMSDYNKVSQDVGCCSDLQYNSCPIYANRSQAAMTTQEITGTTEKPTTMEFNSSDTYPVSWDAWWGVDLKIGLESHKTPANEQHYLDRYDYFTQAVFPLLTVYMSVANKRRQYYIDTKSQLVCTRAQTFTAGSRNNPMPHPDTQSTGLSKGAIGGIAAGSVIGATIIAVAAFLFLRHKRLAAAAATKAGSVSSSGPTELGGDEPKSPVELDKGNEIFEMKGNQGGMEMDADAKKVFELRGDGPDAVGAVESPAGSENARYEMQGDTIQSELESPSGTMGLTDIKEKLEGDEKKEEVEQPLVAELMGSEPVMTTNQTNDARQSWTPSIRLVENVEDEEEKEKDPPKT